MLRNGGALHLNLCEPLPDVNVSVVATVHVGNPCSNAIGSVEMLSGTALGSTLAELLLSRRLVTGWRNKRPSPGTTALSFNARACGPQIEVDDRDIAMT